VLLVVVVVVAAAAAAAALTQFVGTCSYDKRTEHHMAGTKILHVAIK